MAEPDDDRSRQLDDLEARVRAVQERRAGPASRSAKPAGRGTGQIGLGFRISVELLATLAVGTGMGVLLDRWLGTSPWLTLAFFMLGAAAGMRNVIRVATAAQKKVAGDADRTEES
ncbi:MAG: F0F1 ATP synthase subunit I [Alphaproteobacteria bacterium]|nr:F0F1 ATP synthase subunit I [Alphaproteobacteria bacterium]